MQVQTFTQTLPVMEAFYTLQGEGVYQGRAAYFIRLGGCDVGCHWCDVKESWDASLHPSRSVGEIVEEASTAKGRLAVITGGEPLMHDLTELCEALKQEGFRRHIETSGAYPLSGEWDWICFSPKKFKKPLPTFYQQAHELKVVIYHPSDIAWAEEFAQQMNPDCALLLQPEWGKADKILPLLIEYVKENPHWRVSLQTHKFMAIP
jgi:7-carboxy-7-deazaguanine synthase